MGSNAGQSLVSVWAKASNDGILTSNAGVAHVSLASDNAVESIVDALDASGDGSGVLWRSVVAELVPLADVHQHVVRLGLDIRGG